MTAQERPRGGFALLGLVPPIAAFVAGLVGQQVATDLGWPFLLLASCLVIALVAAWARWYRRGIIRWWWWLASLGVLAATGLSTGYQSQNGPRPVVGIISTVLVGLATLIVLSDDALNGSTAAVWGGAVGYAGAALLLVLNWDAFAWYNWVRWSVFAIASGAGYVVGIWSPRRRTEGVRAVPDQTADHRSRAEQSRWTERQVTALAAMRHGKFVLTRSSWNYRWRLEANNGRTIAIGVESNTKAEAIQDIETVRRTVGGPRSEVYQNRGSYHWRLRAANNRIVAYSPSHDSAIAARTDLEMVKRYAPEAPIVDQV